jgi:formylglycine-generating enzyme required for sulfatase activity
MMAKDAAFKIPQDLVKDIAGGKCVLFVGAGLSRGAGLPDWPGLMQRMMDWAGDHGVDLAGVKRELKGFIKDGEYLLVAEELRERMGKERFRRFMAEVFRDDKLRPTATHRLLRQVPFSAVVTTNYDVLLEGAYTSKDGGVPRTYTQEDTPELSNLHREDEFYILKLHGDIDRIETIVLGRGDYRQAMFANPAYRDFLTSLFLSKTVFFVGASLTDPDLMLFLDEMRTAFKGYGRFHYALMPEEGAGKVQRKRLERDYGIQIIPYAATTGHPEVNQFLEQLRDSVRVAKKEKPAKVEVVPTVGLRQATERYLQYLIDRHRYLSFKGMGISERVPLRVSLVDMYIPLKARIELPEAETWARELQLAGRKLRTEGEEVMGRLSEPQPVLDLLPEQDGLIILGDPGAGKTTFLKYLALKLALGEGEELGLGTRLPVLVPLSAYANALAEGDVRLDDFIAGYFHDLGADLPIAEMLEEALGNGNTLVLLDGLDEVRELALRDTAARRVVDFYTFHRQAGNKFALTSRIIGYREVRPTAEGLAECTLVDFEDEEIEAFVDRWTAAIERADRGDTAVALEEAERERRELLEAVHRDPGVRRLAANPLLLTILALMKRQGVRLPDRRVELYDKYVGTLLSSWNLARGLGRPPTRDLDLVETVRILAPLALWMHQVSPGVGLVRQEELKRKLVEIYAERGAEDPERAVVQFLDDVRGHAGLLLERGAGQYGFIHLTFEEYLAAVGVGRLGQREIEPVVNLLAEHVADPAWREVALLTIGYLGIVQQSEEVAGDVVGALLEREPGEPGQAAVLAGEAVADAWPGGVTPVCKEKVVEALVGTMAGQEVRAVLRAGAGRTLARLGDPRPGVMTLEGMQFCYIPPSPFWMGSDDDPEAWDDEKPLHRFNVPYGYWMARYPVTNAQFRAFVEDPEGYAADSWWTSAGLAWREDEGGPVDYGEPWNLANHPRVDVTWYEAVAFTRWLTERLRETGSLPGGWQVRLPSEAEWEKAARGGEEITAVPLIVAAREGLSVAYGGRLIRNRRPKGRYPWGDEPDPERANYDDTGIDTTSAVGCFPAGASRYGVEELSGNVWEWCATKWQDSYEDYQDDSDLEGEAPRVLRGGAFFYLHRRVRCASRLRYFPLNRDLSLGFRVVVSSGSPE